MLKKQVARNLRVSPALLSNWFAGRAVPTGEQFDALEAFVCGLDGVDAAGLRHTWQRAKAAAHQHGQTADDERADLIEFLGSDADSVGVTLVYPEFVLSEGRLVPKDGAEIHSDLAKFPTEVTGSRLSGFGAVVSSHDLGAVAVLADMLGDHGVRVRLGIDAAVMRAGARHPLIAFGFQSNAMTTYYLRRGLGSTPMFDAALDDVQHIVFPDGRSVESAPPLWRGVVMRITPHPLERPARKWLFCAGLGGVGTAIAAHYLAAYWRELHVEAGDADFVAVVAGHEMAPASAFREALYLA
jgi:hypothetical protein